MSTLRRIVMVRHGETEGRSSVRFHGSADVPLNDEGRAQVHQRARRLATEVFDLVVASPLRRSWESAAIVSGGAPIRLEADIREIHFGRWEGLTAEEIEASDPSLYQEWQSGASGFEYPGGEPRAEFGERVKRGLESMTQSGAASILVVGHKGVMREIGRQLLGQELASPLELGGVASLSRGVDGNWFEGRRGSNPEGLEDEPS
jgi:broad specificity phosphatase PhoE